VRTVLTSLPDPAPGTVRRTVSLEVTPEPAWTTGLRVTATARDLLVSQNGDPRVLGAQGLTVTLDARSRITGIAGDLPAAVAGGVLGASAVSGFRAKLTALAGLEPSSLASALLDDLPAVRLISGYALIMEMPEVAPLPGGRSPMVGICAGWAPGATADRRVRAGTAVLTGSPPASALTSMTPYFHAEPAPRPSSMRRRRILDVAGRAGEYEIFEYFRDSHFDPALREGSLHEYVVRAEVSGEERLTLTRIDVEPHALPFPECPLAAPNAQDLTGVSLHEITGTVRARLSGTRGCTHLNDVLRFLRYVPALAASCPDPANRPD
jgi:hypothetical protein